MSFVRNVISTSLKFIPYTFIVAFDCIVTNPVHAQQAPVITIDSLFRLTEQQSKQIQFAREQIYLAEENTGIAKNNRLPDITGEVSVGYLSSAQIWDHRFNYQETMPIPHVSNSYSLEAEWMVFKGESIIGNIEKSKMQEQIVRLDFKKNREDIQLLILAKYLDLLTLYNRKKVYEQNKALAEARMNNAQALCKQGMVTHNDIVRNQLQINDFNLNINEIVNNINIVNNELVQTLALPEQTIIQADTALYNFGETIRATELSTDINNTSALPELQIAQYQIQVAGKDILLSKAEKFPSILLYAGSQLQRPFLYTMPPLDIYTNFSSIGVKLTYNISSLYKSTRHIQKSIIAYRQAELNADDISQQVKIKLYEAEIKYKESIEKWKFEQESYVLAKDNYLVVLHKYINRLAVMTDLVDASTALLSAQLQLCNAQINIVYRYYCLLKQSGNWPEK
ncbi:MAG TPA: TolC family protein [Bacteroidales bacterium]